MGYKDHPDGQACFQKVFEATKYTGAVGFVLSTYDVLMVVKPQGYVPTLGIFLRTTVPCAAAGATFAAITCVSTNLRGKDDKLNYFIGGASAGSVFGAAKNSVKVGFPAAVFLGLAAVLFKDSMQKGWEFFPKIYHKMGYIDYRKFDYTLTKDVSKDK